MDEKTRYNKTLKGLKFNTSICFDCEIAGLAKCSWISRQIPVVGWDADQTIIKDRVGDMDSYLVYDCPLFDFTMSCRKCTNCKNIEYIGDYYETTCDLYKKGKGVWCKNWTSNAITKNSNFSR